FRFCFTNQQMAESVADFLATQPDLRPSGDPLPSLAAVPAAAAGPWAALALPAVQAAEPYVPEASTLVWAGDPYSIGLAAQFHEAFHRADRPRLLVRSRSIPYSVGDFYRANAWESLAADELLRELRASPRERQVLVLPATANAARRVLRALTGAMPL